MSYSENPFLTQMLSPAAYEMGSSVTVVQSFSYDSMGRPLTSTHKVGSGSQRIVSSKVYDALGRLVLENRTGLASLKETRSYNVRSWLTEISGTNFSESLKYENSSSPQWCGNISVMEWGTSSLQKCYRFVYDNQSYGQSFNAVSGRSDDNGAFIYTKERQTQIGEGPIPEGLYYINPQEIQSYLQTTVFQKFLGLIGKGTFPKGPVAWGFKRVWIYPNEVHVYDNVTGKYITRGNFSIHGGLTPGSAGCIDLSGNAYNFFKSLGQSTSIPTQMKQSKRLLYVIKWDIVGSIDSEPICLQLLSSL